MCSILSVSLKLPRREEILPVERSVSRAFSNSGSNLFISFDPLEPRRVHCCRKRYLTKLVLFSLSASEND